MQHFKDLQVWRHGHELVRLVYATTACFPVDERFGVTSQIRRAAVSIPTNIAEGAKRRSRPDYARFLNVAEGSVAEVEYLLILSRDLGFASEDTIRPLLERADHLARMLNRLRARVEGKRIGSALSVQRRA